MNTFRDFLVESSSANENSELPYKAIVFSGGGSSTTFKFAFTEDEMPTAGEVVHVSWEEWKKSEKKDVSDEKMKERFVKALMSGVKEFSQKAELNMKLKKTRTFEDKIDMITKESGQKINKAGVKTKLKLI